MRQAVILAGGKGTRLSEQAGDLPKPMVQVGGKPILEHQIEVAKRHGFEEILLLTGYRSEKIENYFGNGDQWGVRIQYKVDSEPLGTAGSMVAALDLLSDTFLVMYGDTMLDVSLNQLWDFHFKKGADATLLVHPNDHPHDSDLVEMNETGLITALHSYPHPSGTYYRNLVNAALYVINKKVLAPWAYRNKKMDFAKDLFPTLIQEGKQLFAYVNREYIKDMGTPKRLAHVEADLQKGRINALSLERACPAIFFDRDGTLNVEKDRITKLDDLELIPGVGEAVRQTNQAGVAAVVVTNQPVVARGEVTEGELRVIHNKLESLLGESGAYLDAIYWCPHHPHAGYPGERVELKIKCDCRKPEPGLLYQAASDLKLDLARSWFIGDSTSDISAAKKAGVKSVLVQTGHAGRDGKFSDNPDYIFTNLIEAVNFILGQL